MFTSSLHPHEANHAPFASFTRLPLHRAHVHTQTIAIIQPDNHGHFHEKGECEESEHSGPSICCAMWPPRREGETGGHHECGGGRGEEGCPGKSQLFWNLCLLH